MVSMITKQEFYSLKKELEEVKKENEKLKADIKDVKATFGKIINERTEYLFDKICEIKDSAENAAKITSMDMISKEFYKEKMKLIELESNLIKRNMKRETK